MTDHVSSLDGRWREAMRLSRCLLRCSVSVSVSDSVPPPFLTHPLSDQFPSRNLNQFKAHAKEPQTWLQIVLKDFSLHYGTDTTWRQVGWRCITLGRWPASMLFKCLYLCFRPSPSLWLRKHTLTFLFDLVKTNLGLSLSSMAGWLAGR